MSNSLNPTQQKIIDHLKNQKNPVIIFGAGIVGEVLYYACVSNGINVECFCDNNINKTKSSICEKEVIHTSQLKTKYAGAAFLLSTADIKDVVDQLQNMGFSNWYSGNLLLRNFDLSKTKFSASYDFVEYAVSTCLLCHDNYLIPDKLFLRSVDIVITERCSLKCRDCSNLMQYYKKPVNYNTKELLNSIDIFCGFVDEVNEFRVIGGEPFMNKEFHIITKRLIDEPKVKKIIIYTNGTIVPQKYQIEYLKNNKVLIFITDYGLISKKLNILTQILRESSIAFYVQKAQGWTDCAIIRKHDRSSKQEEKIFRDCCAKNTVTLMNGKLFRCPFSANAFQLNAVPESESDYIEFGQTSLTNIYEMKKKIRTFLLEKKSLDTCDYCNGRSFGDPEILPAIQTERPLDFEKVLLAAGNL